MTTQTTLFSLDAIDAALAAAAPSLDEDEQRLAAIVLRLLAAGEPVSIPAAAAVAGMPGPRAEQVLRSWPAVFWDDHGRVTGFWGLALAEMDARLADLARARYLLASLAARAAAQDPADCRGYCSIIAS